MARDRPERAGHLLETAAGHYMSQRYEEAIAVYTAALRELPEDAGTYCSRAECHLRLANYRQAIEDFERASDLDLEEALGRFQTVLSLSDWHPFKRVYSGRASIDIYYWVIDYLQQSLFVFDPGSIQARVQLGDAYAWAQETFWDQEDEESQQQRHYNEALAIPPVDATDYYYRGQAYSGMSDPQSAFDCYTTAIDLDPTYAPAYCDRALIHIDRGDCESAESDLTNAVKLDPKNGIYLYQRGMARLARGEVSGARGDLSKSLQLGYDNDRLRNAFESLNS